jgi:hypothetical protein
VTKILDITIINTLASRHKIIKGFGVIFVISILGFCYYSILVVLSSGLEPSEANKWIFMYLLMLV